MALYYYTLTILLLSITTAAVCLSVFLVTGKKLYLLASAGFALYFFDVALVFRTDVVRRRAASTSSAYEINGPLESVALGAGLIAIFWLLTADYLGRSPRTAIFPTFVFVLTSTMTFFIVPSGKWHEFLFFNVRGLILITILVYIAFIYGKTNNKIEKRRLLKNRSFYIGLWSLTLCIILWNVYFQLMVDYSKTSLKTLPFLPERNFAENVFMLLCAFQAGKSAHRVLRMRSETPPRSINDHHKEYVTQSVQTFGNTYGLSEREREILTFVLDGKDNRAIAGELFLAVSTVKVHVHNILGKTGTANRTELMRAFWSLV